MYGPSCNNVGLGEAQAGGWALTGHGPRASLAWSEHGGGGGNFPAISRNFSQLDLTLPDHPPPAPREQDHPERPSFALIKAVPAQLGRGVVCVPMWTGALIRSIKWVMVWTGRMSRVRGCVQ